MYITAAFNMTELLILLRTNSHDAKICRYNAPEPKLLAGNGGGGGHH